MEFNAVAAPRPNWSNGVVSPDQMVYVNRVLNAAAMTYVAACSGDPAALPIMRPVAAAGD